MASMMENSKSTADEAKPTEKSESAISSVVSSNNTTFDPKIMPNLPLEIIDNIFFFCTRGTLFNCLTLSQNYVGLAIMQLYRSVPTIYYRRDKTDGKLVTTTCTPSVFQTPLNPSLNQALRFAHYRYAVRDIEDTNDMLCGGPYGLPDFAKLVADHPRIRGLKWRQADECDYSLERNGQNSWTNLQLKIYHPPLMLYRSRGQLKRLTKEIGTGISSLKVYDWGDDMEEDFYWDIDIDIDMSQLYRAFIKVIGPHINRLQNLDITRDSFGGYANDIEPVAKILPPSLVNLTLTRRDTVEIERVLKCTLPNLAKFTFSLDFPDNWAYTSRSGASDEFKASPNLKQAVMLVTDAHEWEYEPAPPSAMDTASWLADILPFSCDLTVKLDSEAMCCGRSSPHPWIHRWMIDVEKIYRFHRATMGKSG